MPPKVCRYDGKADDKSKVCGAETKRGAPCRLRTKTTYPCCYIHTMHAKRGSSKCAGNMAGQGYSDAPLALRVKRSNLLNESGRPMKGLFVQAPAKFARRGKNGQVRMGMNNATPPQRTKVVFEKGEVIAEYFGQKISKRELEKRYPGDTVAAYAYRHDDKLIVDSRAWCSGIARYANDACRGKYRDRSGAPARVRKDGTRCAATNARFEVRKGKILVVAVKPLHDGDEIYVEYDAEYWGED